MGVAILKDRVYAIGGLTDKWPGFNSLQMPTLTKYDTNEVYTPAGYGTPDSSYVPPVESTPPRLSVLSPLNQRYNDSSVSLIYSANKPVNWTTFSLDGKENVTLSGNTTLTGLTNGFHNITVYAQDTFGNIGASQNISFTVAKPEPESFPIVPVAAVSIVAVALVVAGLLVYHKKHKHNLVKKV
jgi:hypothetical protein